MTSGASNVGCGDRGASKLLLSSHPGGGDGVCDELGREKDRAASQVSGLQSLTAAASAFECLFLEGGRRLVTVRPT